MTGELTAKIKEHSSMNRESPVLQDADENRDKRNSRKLLSYLQSIQVLGLTLFAFSVAFPPFESTTEISLPVHMLQHVLITAAGVMIAYPIYRSGKIDRYKSTRNALLGFAAMSVLVVFWHIPVFWDAAVLSFWTHILEHFCFLAIGIMIGVFIPMFPDNVKMLVAVMAISAHMFYGFALYLINTPVYPLYPVYQQAELGLLLFAPSPFYLGTYLYLNLTRESKKLDLEFTMSANGAPTLDKAAPNLGHHHRSGNPRSKILISVLVLMMIVSMVGYYAGTFVIISSASYSPSPTISYVYIQEGPINWQYTPQHVTVVLGVNNTVTWISQSYTYDTVTSANDSLFSSGPISPGGSFTFTFTDAGTFRYYCVYHLWMSGTITVLPGK